MIMRILRACLSVRFQGFTPTPPYRPSASSRLWPTRAAALRLPDPCGLGSDSHGGNVFSGKLLEFLTQTGSQNPLDGTKDCSSQSALRRTLEDMASSIRDWCFRHLVSRREITAI